MIDGPFWTKGFRRGDEGDRIDSFFDDKNQPLTQQIARPHHEDADGMGAGTGSTGDAGFD